jgi:hypothetical protein
MSGQSTPGKIEVSASDAEGDLRYWKAREAVRQGEARLTAQAAIRTAMEARATAITGWAAASLLVVTAAGFAAPSWPSRGGAALTAFVLLAAAGLCIYAVRPRDWGITGYDPQIIMGDPLGTELEVVESIADGISPSIQANNRRLNSMGKLLRWAGWLLIAAPFPGAAVYAAWRAFT